MIETKRAANGAGLAAPQVGESLRIAIAEVEPDNPRYPYKPPIPLTVFVNPVIEPLDDELVDDQRGLPLGPRTCAARSRATLRSASATSTATGVEHEEVKRGLTAGTFQHEVDHLDGVLFLDRVDPRTLTTWEQFERFHREEFVRPGRASSSSGSDRDRATGASSPGSAATGPSRGVAGRGRGRADRLGRGRRAWRPPAGATRLDGLTLPGARQRALARLSPGAARVAPSAAAAASGPGARTCTRSPPGSTRRRYQRLARATFAEMALAGITAVGEFHYLHHGPGGAAVRRSERDGRGADRRRRRGRDPDHPARRVLSARRHRRAAERGPARASPTATPTAWAERVDALADGDGVRIGAAIHSVRAVDPDSAAAVAAWAGRATDRPLHAHVSEQPAENDACRQAYGPARPAVLERAGALSGRLHRRARDAPRRRPTSPRSAAPRCGCCLCPTTERDLADGIGPAMRSARGGRVARARLRLARGHRPVRGGARARARRAARDRRARPPPRGRAARARDRATATRRSAGPRRARSRRAPTPTWSRSGSTGSVSPARPPRPRSRRAVFAATAADVERVICGGREIVRDGAHTESRRRRRAARLDRGGARVTASVIDRIGLLVTNDPALGEGELGIVRDAALVIEDGRVAAIEPAGADGRRALRRRRALRDPGLRRQPHPPDLRRRPRRRVRRADGGGAVRGRRDPR